MGVPGVPDLLIILGLKGWFPEISMEDGVQEEGICYLT